MTTQHLIDFSDWSDFGVNNGFEQDSDPAFNLSLLAEQLEIIKEKEAALNKEIAKAVRLREDGKFIRDAWFKQQEDLTDEYLATIAVMEHALRKGELIEKGELKEIETIETLQK